jgi:putative exporter of polyketide antibiotics
VTKATLLIIAVTALAFITAIFSSAFTTFDDFLPEAQAEGESQPDASAATEATQTFLIFVFGIFCQLAMKKRHVLARQFDQFVGRANAAASTAIARFTAVARLRPQWPSWLNQGTMSIVVAGMLCTGCITYLFVSAFQATPGEEPMNDGSPDPSTKTKMFTMGWMIFLVFKLRSELVSAVGSGALFQPF